jgi:predicted DNA-binding ribbon-helix-helix protein
MELSALKKAGPKTEGRRTPLQSTILKRSVAVGGRKTSISIERPFLERLEDIARDRRVTVNALVTTVDRARGTQSLSRAVRLMIFEHTLQRATGSDAGAQQ